MANEIQFILAAVPIFLYMLIPGFLVSLGLLGKTKLKLFEIFAFGMVLGTVIPPFLMFFVYIFGLNYSLLLAALGFLLSTAVGAALCYQQGTFERLKDIDFSAEGDTKRLVAWAALVIIMVWALWVRTQSLSPVFYEFDPYFYEYATQYLLVDGRIPMQDVTAWYPVGADHLAPPLSNFLTASWYSLYTQGGAYNNLLLATVAGLYPPLVGALMCFLAYKFVSEGYGMKYGLLAASFTAFLPQLIRKFAAGESEIQPWGVYSLMFFLASYAMVVKRRELRFAALAGIAYMSVILGSQYGLASSLIFAGYMGIEAILSFLRNQDLKKFVQLNGVVVGAVVLSTLLRRYYQLGFNDFAEYLTTDMLVVIVAFAFVTVLYYASKKFTKVEQKIYALSALAVIGLIILFATPLGGRVTGYVEYAAGYAKPSDALMMTVAEEGATAGTFQYAFGFLGSSVLGDLNMVHVILFFTAFFLVYSVLRDSKLALLYALAIFPISYVGMSKSKYVLQLGLMLSVAFCVSLGELEHMLKHAVDHFAKSMKKQKREFDKESYYEYAVYGCFAIGVAFVLLSGVGPFFDGPVPELTFGLNNPAYLNQFPTGFNCRDVNPENELLTEYYCAAKYNCSRIGNDEKMLLYYLRCNTIPAYWLDSMEWVKDETPEDARLISWWDYGHWINFFGERDCLTRNEHANSTVDLQVADKFVDATPQELAAFMREKDSEYVLFDIDLVNKWGALNFLSCVYNNQTNMSFAQSKSGGMGKSECEYDHSFEHVFVPLQRTMADYCPMSTPEKPLVYGFSNMGVAYCIEEDTSAGYVMPITVYDNSTGNMVKVHLQPEYTTKMQDGRDYGVYKAYYFKNSSAWSDGESGWGDRKGKFYDSNFYNAFYLGELEGFELAYEYVPPEGGLALIRIFKLKEA